MSAFKRVLVAAILIGAFQIVPGQPVAYATVSCLNSNIYGSLFDGLGFSAVDSTGNTFTGASATLQNKDATICDTGLTTSDNFWYNWAMISENTSAGGGRAYAQSGIMRYYGSCRYYTSEYQNLNGGGAFTRDLHAKTLGCISNASDHYWVEYSGGHFKMNLNSTTLATTPYGPYGNWALPMTPQFSAETKYFGSNVPGSSSAKEAVTSQQLQNFDGSWTSSIPSGFHICPWPYRYLIGDYGSANWNIWSDTSTGITTHC